MRVALLIAAVLALVQVTSATICSDYLGANAGAQETNIRMLVEKTALGGYVNPTTNANMAGLFGNPLTEPFFDGTHPTWRNGVYMFNELVPGSNASLPDFTVGANSANLVTHLVGFFGQALGCTQTGASGAFPDYNGKSDQTQIHVNMPITQTVMTAFIGELGGAAAYLNVSSAGISSVATALNAFQRRTPAGTNQICNMATGVSACTCVTGYSGAECTLTAGASTVSVSIFALLAAAVVATFFGRQ